MSSVNIRKHAKQSRYERIRKAAFEANIQLPKLGLVLFTFGNASAADRAEGVFAIKPSGVPYEDLSPEGMVIVDFDGRTVEGELRPSSDTKTHAVLYKHWPAIGGGRSALGHPSPRSAAPADCQVPGLVEAVFSRSGELPGGVVGCV